jgi:protease-4
MTQEPPQESTAQPPQPPEPPPGTGYYQGPWPPPANAQRREGFWSVVWRTTTKSVIVAAIGGITFAVAMLIFFVALAAIIGSAFDSGDDDDLDTDFVYGDKDAGDRLLIVRVDGVILGEQVDEPLFSGGYAYGYEIKAVLRMAAEEDDIRGVLLWMSTPGGTIYGSRAIADGVAAYKAASGNPVVAYVSGVSASGGMYAMSGADLVLADHGSLVGSIGVIFGPFTFYDGVIATEGGLLGGGVTTSDGITIEYLTAGRSKDVGNPFRPLTSEERRALQEGLDAEYEVFVNYVAEQRGLEPSTIREAIGAMIYSNAQAEAFGLIDGTATLEESYERLATMAGLEAGEYQVVEESGADSIFGALVQAGADAEALAALAASAPELCLPTGSLLAYWGDPSALCWR